MKFQIYLLLDYDGCVILMNRNKNKNKKWSCVGAFDLNVVSFIILWFYIALDWWYSYCFGFMMSWNTSESFHNKYIDVYLTMRKIRKKMGKIFQAVNGRQENKWTKTAAQTYQNYMYNQGSHCIQYYNIVYYLSIENFVVSEYG